MVETEGDPEPTTESKSSPGLDERPSPAPSQDTLQVPTGKRRRIKSPTPGSLRGRSMTPIRGRSQTPFTLYLNRRSATPATWRSITPFLKREDKEKTPFELGKSVKPQLMCNKAVFDKALIMDITEPEVEPVRYITTDMSVIDRAAVMDISNVEVIYVVEEYEEEFEEEEEEGEAEAEGEKPEGEKKKKKKKKEKTEKKKKKEKKEKSPSPKLTLKLEIGGGAMQSKKLFQDQEKKAAMEKEQAKPPPKKKTKSKFQLQMEENAKLAKAAAEKEAKAKAELEEKKKEKEKKRKEREEARKQRILEELEERKKQEEDDRKKWEEEERRIIEEEEKARQTEKEERLAKGESLELIESELKAAAEKAAAERAAAREKAIAIEAEAVAALEAEMEEEESEEEEEEGAEGADRDEKGDETAAQATGEGDGAEEDGEVAEAGEAGSEAEEGDQEQEAEESGEGGSSEGEQEGGDEVEIALRRERRRQEKGEIEVEVKTPDILEKLRKRREVKESKVEEAKEEVKVEKPKKVEPPPPDPEDIRWKEIASEIGEEIAVTMRKFCKEHPPLRRGETRPPIISLSLSDAATEEGNPVKLQCAAYGSSISYKWLKDGKGFDRGPRVRITQFNIDESNVVITTEMFGTTPQDSAEYSCVVSNSAGEATTSCMVSVYQVFKDEPLPPTINYITEHYHLYDDELTIECQCRGIPRPKVTWFKDNYEVKQSLKYSMLEEAHGIYKLLIYQPSVKDNGLYMCRALNDSGQQEITHSVEFVKPKTFHLHHAQIETEKDTKEGIKQSAEEGKKGEKKIRTTVEDVIVPPKNKIIIATQLRDRTALEGTTVKLACAIIGPNPTIRWYKNDQPIQMGPTVRNLSTEGKAMIELSKVTVDSSGLYKCVAKNQYNEVDTQCYLKVYTAKAEGNKQEPMFVLPIRDVYHLSENDLIIDTKIRGNPRPTILWLKDEMPVVLDTRVQQIEHIDGVCELIINKPTLKDSGNYSCVAENSLGITKVSHVVVVDVPPPSRKLSGTGSMGEEKEVLLNSKKEAEDAEQKGKQAKGKKKVEASGEEGGRRRHPAPEPSPKDKLYFIAFLTNRYLVEGSKVKLSAVVGGRDPQIKWLKDGNNVQYSPRVRNMSKESLAILEITNAKVEDSGEYTVVARNSANEISSSALLNIYQSKVTTDLEPLFTRALKETYHLNTNELILETHVRGNPTPIITWLKDSVEIDISKKYQIIDHSDGTCELIIDKPSNRDSGKYVCKAENSVGQSEISHYVLFEGKESYIADNVHGIFHADKNLMKSKEKIKDEQDKTKEEKKEGKGKGKVKGKAKSGKEESEPVTKETSAKEEKQQKLEKREKRIGIHFDANLTDRVVAEGSRVKLTCYVQGTSPAIKWLRDDQPVQYGPKVRQFYREGLCILELLNPTVEDTGFYKCYAKDNTGEATTFCKLTVYSRPGSADIPPTFTRAIKDTYHGKVNELILDCHVRGLPTPSIVWLKDSVKIEACAKFHQIEHADGTCELIINDPLPFDSGKYVCQAENRVNSAEISHMVQIQTRDIRPGSPIREISPRQEKSGEKAKEDEKKEEKKKKKAPSEAGGRVRRSAAPPPDPRKQLYFRSFLANRVAAEGTKVRLSVYIDGPDPQVRWFKNDNPVTYGPKTQAVCQNGLAVLVLQRLTDEDSGEYKIVARNSESEISTACNLTVYKIEQEESVSPVFTVGIKDTYYLSENELVLDCRVRGNPCPKIEWLKNNELIKSSSKYRQLDQADGYCKLIINDPTEKDSGVYTCRAENPVNTEKISHTVDFAGRERIILEKTHGFFHRDPNKPHLTTPLGNHIVTAGGTIAIQAEFLPTYSPIEVQWLRNKAPIATDGNIKTFVEHGVYTLAVEKANRDFSGTYTCRASNAFGRIETHANVHVIGPVIKGGKPAFFLSRPENAMTVLTNNPVSISFRVQGDPKPKLTFMKGTKDITQSERVSKEVTEDYIRFTLHNAQIADSGTYFVVARNDHGTDRVFVTVTVRQRARSTTPTLPRWGQPLENYSEVSFFKNPPEPISSEPILVDSGKNHISLSWGKPYNNNSAPVIAYRVDAWLVGKDGGAIWHELGVTPINSFDVFNLKHGCEYHFRVTPRNRYGWGKSVQTSSPILIGGAEYLPEFTKILPGQMKALIDKECILECHVKGSPRPNVVWYKDGQKINSTDRVSIRQIGSICRLKISQIFEVDSGRYTCEATNNQGKVSTFARLQAVSDPKIYEADHKLKEYINSECQAITEMLPQFTMRLRDRRVQVTHPVRLTCQVIGYPEPELTWHKDGKEIQTCDRFLICDDKQFNTLEIASTALEDSGTYSATAKNELGSVSCHCSLVVDKGIRAYIAPDFYMALDPVYTFQEGKEIRLTAKVEAYPTVGVAWYRNGTRLRPSRKILATLDHDGFVELIIADITQKDSGIYCCIASNAVGRMESSCRVVVEPGEKDKRLSIPEIKGYDMPYSKEPMFVKKPRSSEAYEGDTVIIFCEVVGDPKPEVVWLRDFLKPEYYKDAPHFKRIGDGPEYRLEIPSAKLEFTGTYSVIATNCHGEVKAIISLQIYAKDISKIASMDKGSIKHGNVETLPSIIRHLKDVRCCDGDSITLECHVEAVPEPVIIWEKDGRVLSSEKDFIMSYDGFRATLSIPRIYPEDEGEYLCIASNNIGRAGSSACIIVDVPEEKENLLSSQLSRPVGLFLSAASTPRSTPRTTPIRHISPLRLSYRHSSIDLTPRKQKFATPKFYAIPHNRVVEEGETVTFQCAIAGHPMPWSTWDKDGVVVTQTSRISIKERDDIRILEIEQVTFDDAGLYRITLENDYGRIEATARLDVIGNGRGSSRSLRTSSASPRRNINLSRRLMGNSTQIGGRLMLSARFRGSSVPARKFYHNGEEIIECDRIHICSNNYESYLIIDKVEESDEGIYACVAENEFGFITTFTSVVFYKSEGNIPNDLPKLIKHLPDEIYAHDGETVDLTFELDCCEPYIYTWTKDGEILDDSNEFSYIDHGNGLITLRIHDAFDMDAGMYTCTVNSKNGSCKTCCNLYVDDKAPRKAKSSALDILKYPLPIIGKRGSIASFSIRVNPPNADVKWFVCGREITCDSREFSIETETSGVRILHVLGLDYHHNGEVKAIVRDPHTRDEIISYTEITIFPAPLDTVYNFEEITNCTKFDDVPAYIIKGPDDCNALIGGTVTLDVAFGGYPVPKVKWLKAGHAITESWNVKISTSETYSKLSLTSITTDDSGKYTVEVMNEHSSDFAVASVAVEGPPEPPSGKPSVSQGPDRIAIAWCGPPYDGGCMLTGFIIEMQENDQEWLEIATIVDSLAYTVKNLKEGSTYRFRVRAVNIHGKSEPGLSSDEVTIERKMFIDDNDNKMILLRPGGDFKLRFDILEELGKGRFGTVYKVMEKETRQMLAAKIIKCIKSKDRMKIHEEISIMKSLHHPKLLQLAATFENPKEIIMIMEYITGGELFERVVADDFTLTERDCILFVRQICEGVEYMHNQSIVHLDLKPENIMCHTRTSHQIKIIDFGLAQRLTSDTPIRVLFGTPEFIPPEIINYEPISFESDMWSVGVICYVLLSGLSPFMGDTDVETFTNITRADYDFDDEAFDAVSQEAKEFISNLLLYKKEDRLSAKQCLQSSWLSQHDENLSNNKICTDKLKKFIIRRKWQVMSNWRSQHHFLVLHYPHDRQCG